VLAREIELIWIAAGETYGVPQMTRWLQLQGFEVNHKRVARIMGELGSEGESGRRRVRSVRRPAEDGPRRVPEWEKIPRSVCSRAGPEDRSTSADPRRHDQRSGARRSGNRIRSTSDRSPRSAGTACSAPATNVGSSGASTTTMAL
jgi:hypothetical protein